MIGVFLYLVIRGEIVISRVNIGEFVTANISIACFTVATLVANGVAI